MNVFLKFCYSAVASLSAKIESRDLIYLSINPQSNWTYRGKKWCLRIVKEILNYPPVFAESATLSQQISVLGHPWVGKELSQCGGGICMNHSLALLCCCLSTSPGLHSGDPQSQSTGWKCWPGCSGWPLVGSFQLQMNSWSHNSTWTLKKQREEQKRTIASPLFQEIQYRVLKDG